MHLLSPFTLNLPLYEHKKRPSYVSLFYKYMARSVKNTGNTACACKIHLDFAF